MFVTKNAAQILGQLLSVAILICILAIIDQFVSSLLLYFLIQQDRKHCLHFQTFDPMQGPDNITAEMIEEQEDATKSADDVDDNDGVDNNNDGANDTDDVDDNDGTKKMKFMLSGFCDENKKNRYLTVDTAAALIKAVRGK